jgi:hypothetical protein
MAAIFKGIIVCVLVVFGLGGARAEALAAPDILGGASAEPLLLIGFKCGLIPGKLCGDAKASQKKHHDDDDDDHDQEKHGKKDKHDDHGKKDHDGKVKSCAKKVKCKAGEIVLDKPNASGSCCEAKAEKCPLPNQIGTPPNCKCQRGYELSGSQGCVLMKPKCTSYDYGPNTNISSLEAITTSNLCGCVGCGQASCGDPASGKITCCCVGNW